MAWSIQNLISTQVLAVALGHDVALANDKEVPMRRPLVQVGQVLHLGVRGMTAGPVPGRQALGRGPRRHEV